MRQKPVLSVIIPTYGAKGAELTKQCLESFPKSGLGGEGLVPEIFVVDDGSDSDTLRTLSDTCEAHGVYKLIHSQTNTAHFAYLCNEAMRQSNGHVVFLMNNDIILKWGCLQILTDMVLNMNVGVVAPKLLYQDERIQFAGTYYVPNQENPREHGWFDHYLRFMPSNHELGVKTRQSLLTGALLGISRGVIDTIGLLDERFELSCEDVDYSIRAMLANINVAYCSHAEAYHLEGTTRGKTLEEKAGHPEWTEREKRSLDFLFDKWSMVNWNQFALRYQ